METRVCFDCEAGGEVGALFEEMKQSTAAELRMNARVEGMGRALLGMSSCGNRGRTFMEIGAECSVYDRKGRVATLTIPLTGRFSNCNSRQWPRQGKGRSHFISSVGSQRAEWS